MQSAQMKQSKSLSRRIDELMTYVIIMIVLSIYTFMS